MLLAPRTSNQRDETRSDYLWSVGDDHLSLLTKTFNSDTNQSDSLTPQKGIKFRLIHTIFQDHGTNALIIDIRNDGTEVPN
jgi:hypothetical protein